jgi:LmbE family N-acetylglucosaminyl deacetylase
MNILIVVAHPDDEVLGCGGAIAKHTEQGDRIHILILAEGVTSRDSCRNRDTRESELSELGQVAHHSGKILGVTSVTLHDFPDNRMDSCDLLDVVKVVEKAIAEYSPEVIYTHHSGDLNIDHRITHQAVVTAARPLPGSLVKTLLFFEVPSSTEWQTPNSATGFNPNWFIDISDELKIKLKALNAYQSEMRDWPHSRSIDAVKYLAKWRGATVGVEAAEAFILGRKIT